VRKNNWQSALHNFIDSRRKEPHKWGYNDCALFVADAVQEITGNDYAADFRGKYRSAKGSVKALRDRGYTDVSGVPDSLFNSVPADKAMKGDVVSITRDKHVSLGICLGHIAAFTGPEGLSFLSMKDIEKAWRID